MNPSNPLAITFRDPMNEQMVAESIVAATRRPAQPQRRAGLPAKKSVEQRLDDAEQRIKALESAKPTRLKPAPAPKDDEARRRARARARVAASKPKARQASKPADPIVRLLGRKLTERELKIAADMKCEPFAFAALLAAREAGGNAAQCVAIARKARG